MSNSKLDVGDNSEALGEFEIAQIAEFTKTRYCKVGGEWYSAASESFGGMISVTFVDLRTGEQFFVMLDEDNLLVGDARPSMDGVKAFLNLSLEEGANIPPNLR